MTSAEELSSKNQLDFMHFLKLIKMDLSAALPLLKVLIASKRVKTEFVSPEMHCLL